MGGGGRKVGGRWGESNRARWGEGKPSFPIPAPPPLLVSHLLQDADLSAVGGLGGADLGLDLLVEQLLGSCRRDNGGGWGESEDADLSLDLLVEQPLRSCRWDNVGGEGRGRAQMSWLSSCLQAALGAMVGDGGRGRAS